MLVPAMKLGKMALPAILLGFKTSAACFNLLFSVLSLQPVIRT